LFLSVGVGTAIINISACFKSSILVVYDKYFASFKSFSVVSKVESCPFFNSTTLSDLISKPITLLFLPNSTASGNPT